MNNYWLDHAINRIDAGFNDVVDVYTEVPKDLLKFGRNTNIGTSSATIMDLAGSEVHETYVSTNIIDTVSSSNASDTESCVIEGHTVDGDGNFIFVVQDVTLNGRNKVVLTTPLARVSRFYANGSADLLGSIYVYEDGNISNGVPSTNSEVHMIVPQGLNQSRKASTTISSTQYWLINSIYTGIEEKTAAFASITLEIRRQGKVFRDVIDIAVSSGKVSHDFKPWVIVPPNADVRLTAIADGAGTDISGGIQGIILRVRS